MPVVCKEILANFALMILPRPEQEKVTRAVVAAGELGGSQGALLPSEASDLGHRRIRVQFDGGEKLVAGFFDFEFHAQPVEQRA